MSWYWEREDSYTRGGVAIPPDVLIAYGRTDEPLAICEFRTERTIEHLRESGFVVSNVTDLSVTIAVDDALSALRCLPGELVPPHVFLRGGSPRVDLQELARNIKEVLGAGSFVASV